VDGAQEAIHRARELALRTDATELDDILVAAHQAQLWVAQGDLEAAWHWLEERGLALREPEAPVVDVALRELEARIDQDFIVSRRRRTAEYATLVRVLLAQGHAAEALAVLKPLLVIAERWGLGERVIRFQILRALALQAQDETALALDALDHALTLAEPAGYVRPFVDAGEPLAQLLYRAAERGAAPQYAGRLLAEFPTLQPADRGPRAEMVEPLSERELDVLQLIAEGLSNQEIADRLFISPRTVGAHVGNILNKLHLANRVQATLYALREGVASLDTD
jgi:LuxR family maltose regulon positive regulatory protein